MDHLFAAFIIIGVMLEIYELNRARLVALPTRKFSALLTSLLSSALVYGLFMIAGFYAQTLLPELGVVAQKGVAVTLIAVVVAYSLFRDKRYNKAGKMVYGNFNLFVLISVGRGILHLITGFILALMAVPGLWVLESYAFGIIIFGIGVILAKGDRVRIFGISVGYIKVVSYAIATFLILIN
ncbi:hypothetical protein L21SP5_02430 [Salinivirga cyanobacteriivorans]|uniref:Uncharacterized protein n=1 Tax=Salinivirga cyanobacteriivorans TaxID=1307839 RepID=A0A0S2I164_9BACT|nr:hypothetical protein [Salinivirga cyanobacteriivorans]ALO16058.1 hypothetical protein L21SP5_02430 [Salinivirga cyanobacteriivorans]